MGTFFKENIFLLGTLAVSLLLQLVAAYYMLRLVKESEELEEGNIRLLREWMEEYIRNEKEITNIPAYVEKKLCCFKAGRLTLMQLKHASGQLLLLVIFLAGVKVCREIIAGKTLGEILPFYIFCLLGLYLHFLLSGFLDMEEKKKRILSSWVDFLENKSSCMYGKQEIQVQEEIEEGKNVFEQEQELKDLLREILT